MNDMHIREMKSEFGMKERLLGLSAREKQTSAFDRSKQSNAENPGQAVFTPFCTGSIPFREARSPLKLCSYA